VVEVETSEVGTRAKEDTAGALLCRFVVDEDIDLFDLRKMTDDLRINPGDGLELAGPVLGVVRPRDPGGGVWCPLGGHAVVLLAWCGHFGCQFSVVSSQ